MSILPVKWLLGTVSGAHVLQLLFLIFLMIKRVYAMLEAMRSYTYLRGVLVSEEHFSQDFLVPSALSVLFLLLHGCCISPNMTFQGPLPYQRCTYDWFNFMFLHVFLHSSLTDLIPQLSITFMDQYFISFS